MIETENTCISFILFVSNISFIFAYNKNEDMEYLADIERPNKAEQLAAMQSYGTLAATLERLRTENPEIEIEETAEKIKVPLKALKLLAEILKATSQGKPVSLVPIATEMTTQAAAELLGCSRPHLVKLLEEGQIPFTMIGRHRRVRFEDVMGYKRESQKKREDLLTEMMKSDEELGLYGA